MSRRNTWLAGRRPYLLLGALCIFLYLPGIAAIPVLDRDEARFAQASRQMLETGDFVRIRFQDEARNNKPAGIYWLQAASVGAFSTPQSTAIWPYRLPSLVGATLAVLMTFGFGRALLRDATEASIAAPTALIAAVILATALGTMTEAHIAKTDAALLAAIVAGQGALGLAYVRGRSGGASGPGVAAVFWIAQIAAILLKGPIGPALAIVTAATLAVADRDARWLGALRPVIGMIATLAAIAPWLIAIERASEGEFIAGSLGHDFLTKLIGTQESHGAPPFSYLALAMLSFWPGSLLLVPALLRGWHRHELPIVRFLLAWTVPAWVILELVPTKLPHYALPLYPALALLAAGMVAEPATDDQARWERWVAAAATALWVVVTLVLAAALVVLPMRYGAGASAAAIFGAGTIIVLMAALLYRRPAPAETVALLAALALALAVPAASWIVPNLDRLWLSREAVAMLVRHPLPAGRRVIVIGYNEPSLVFLLGDALQTTDIGMGARLSGGGEAVVNARQAAMFEQEMAARGLPVWPVDRVAGTDYSNGQRTVLTLYRVGEH